VTDIAGNIRQLKEHIPASVKIVAVSKTKPAEDLLSAYNAGQRIFGENRVQELLAKKNSLPADIIWHFIGHLQTNKVKQIVGVADTIESVDSFKLLTVINSEAAKSGIVAECLLQFHIAMEDTKFGFDMKEVLTMMGSYEYRAFANVRVCGVMGMATFTDDMRLVRKEFAYLRECFEGLKSKYFIEDPYFKEISMGMSGDYKVALEEGSTMVRLGSLIFGGR
jgi:PLP dependent protein